MPVFKTTSSVPNLFQRPVHMKGNATEFSINGPFHFSFKNGFPSPLLIHITTIHIVTLRKDIVFFTVC